MSSVDKLQQSTGGAAGAANDEPVSPVPQRDLTGSGSPLHQYMPDGQIEGMMNQGFVDRHSDPEGFQNWGETTIAASQSHQEELATRQSLYPDYASSSIDSAGNPVDANGNAITDEDGNPVDYWKYMDSQYGAGFTDNKTVADATNTQFETTSVAFNGSVTSSATATLEAGEMKLGANSDYTGSSSGTGSPAEEEVV